MSDGTFNKQILNATAKDILIRQLTHVTNLEFFEYTTNYIIFFKHFSITSPQDLKKIIVLKISKMTTIMNS